MRIFVKATDRKTNTRAIANGAFHGLAPRYHPTPANAISSTDTNPRSSFVAGISSYLRKIRLPRDEPSMRPLVIGENCGGRTKCAQRLKLRLATVPLNFFDSIPSPTLFSTSSASSGKTRVSVMAGKITSLRCRRSPRSHPLAACSPPLFRVREEAL